ncbi:DUF551 domain-containing protein [Xenorhabdus sp. SF857]|uniref:DUF551 domain-containing protein n=1 Tax=Xenorhabdus bakwenae TaxID=3026967 RepID=UPI002558007C|nr:DUF551 domain-containing protein [Xenorhabdus sp. SF857]WFQ80224.1 DUF551 domain-containing protein [Xenorhabdus sp. SF857]
MEWIKCSDRLPEIDEIVLGCEFYTNNGNYKCRLYGRAEDGEYWYWGVVNRLNEIEIDDEYNVEYWMPFPEPPKGE